MPLEEGSVGTRILLVWGACVPSSVPPAQRFRCASVVLLEVQAKHELKESSNKLHKKDAFGPARLAVQVLHWIRSPLRVRRCTLAHVPIFAGAVCLFWEGLGHHFEDRKSP